MKRLHTLHYYNDNKEQQITHLLQQ